MREMVSTVGFVCCCRETLQASDIAMLCSFVKRVISFFVALIGTFQCFVQ